MYAIAWSCNNITPLSRRSTDSLAGRSVDGSLGVKLIVKRPFSMLARRQAISSRRRRDLDRSNQLHAEQNGVANRECVSLCLTV